MTEEEELDILLEKVRQQASQSKSWATILKTARSNMMEKKNVLDADDKAQLKKSLDYLQKFRKVSNRKDLFSHLKDLVQPQELSTGLQFSHMGPDAVAISKTEFYVEISAPEDTGKAAAVMVAHENVPAKSTMLLNLLNECQWEKFMRQIVNLNQFYPDSKDSSVKAQVFKSLMTLEEDIAAGGSSEASGKVDMNSIMESPIGLVRARDAGNPLKVLYFCTPYDLLNMRNRKIASQPGAALLESGTGHGVELVVSGSQTNHLLPKQRVVTAALTQKSSKIPKLAPEKGTVLPGHFILKLSKPIPMLNSFKKLLESATGLPLTVEKSGNLISFLLEEILDPASLESSNRRGIYVKLPDQLHRYMLETDSHHHMAGHLVTSIGITETSSFLEVISCLRKQLKFNSIIQSFVRRSPQRKSSPRNAYHVFVSAPNIDKVECIVQLPESKKDVETQQITNMFSFSPSAMTVQVKEFQEDGSLNDQPGSWNSYASTVFSKTWSIPVTIRAVSKKYMGPKYGYDPKMDEDDDGNDGTGRKRGHRHDDNGSNEFTGGDADQGNEKRNRRLDRGDSNFSGQSNGMRMSAAWLPSKSPFFYRDTDAKPVKNVTFTVERPIIGSACLLDIFKEPKKWKELIPPKQDQIPIKSPIPFYPAASTASRLHEMLASSGTNLPSPQIPANVTSRQGQGGPSIRGRHLSSSSSDTFAEMDSICRMANEAYGGHQSVEGGPPGNETPGGTRPGGGRYERKNSIQDVVDIVASGSPFSQPEMSPGSVSSMPPPSQSPQVQQSPQAASQHGTPSPVSSIFPTQPKLLHSKSVELDLLAQQQHMGVAGPGGIYPRPPYSARIPTSGTRGMDIFEFRDEMVAQDGSRVQQNFQNPLMQSGVSPTTPQMMPTFAPFGAMGQAPQAANQSGRGRGRGTGRRRSNKKLGNVGDRPTSQPGMDPPAIAKKPRGTGTRSRRRRGTANQSHTHLAPSAQMTSAPMTLKFPDVQKIEVDEKWNTQRSNFNSLPKVAEDWIKKTPEYPQTSSAGNTPGMTPPSAKVSGAGLEDSDDSDSVHGDQKLRQEMQDFMVSVSGAPPVSAPMEPPPPPESPFSSSAPTKEAKPSSANVFEHLQNLKSTVPSPADGSSSNAHRSKPNILAKNPPQRKGSLDLIAGKLMAKAGANPFAPQAGASGYPIELSDDEGSSQETFPYRKKNATTELSDDVFTTIGDPPALEEEKPKSEAPPRKDSGATNSPADGEGIRLVIKKNQLKTPDRDQGLKNLVKPKLSSSGLSHKPQKVSSKKPIVSGSQSNDPRSAALQAAKARLPGTIGKKRKTDDNFKRANSEKVLKPLAKKLEKQTSVTGVSSSAETALKGICFTQTLKGFRIPKVVDEKPKETPPPQASPKTTQPEPTPPPPPPALQRETPRNFQPQIRPAPAPSRPPEPAISHPVPIQPKPPKSILKQTGSMPPKLQAEIQAAGILRPGGGRKTLLPNPGSVGPPPTPPRGVPPPSWNTIRPDFTPFQTATIVPLHNPFTEDPTAAAATAAAAPRTSSPTPEASSIRSPDADTIQSPDDPNRDADDSKSPVTLNTSKDSGDRSPGLAIALDDHNDQS